MKFVSWRVRPGVVDEDRICDMRTGRPVRVARRRRVMRWRWPVKFSGCWRDSSKAMVGGGCLGIVLGRAGAGAGVGDAMRCDGDFFLARYR
jgi:hypothetical protein